jgi:hypothetical protein
VAFFGRQRSERIRRNVHRESNSVSRSSWSGTSLVPP